MKQNKFTNNQKAKLIKIGRKKKKLKLNDLICIKVEKVK